MAIIKIKNPALKLLDTPNGKIAGNKLDVSFENITDTGTEGTRVASGTTAQRGSTTGQWRFNSTTGFFEGVSTGGSIASLEPTPTVTSVDVTEINPLLGGNQTIVVTGTNFTSGGTISFIGSNGTEVNANSTIYNSETQVTAVEDKATFTNALEPWKIKFTSASGKVGTSATGLIYSDQDPSWTTSAGNVGNILESTAISPVIQLSATDPDGDSVVYSETTSALSGAGFSLSSSGAITGTAQTVSGDTTTTFDVRATANGKTADRTFNIVTKNLNTQAILFDATNLSPTASGIPTSNGNGLGSVYPTTAVTLTNVNGSTGTLAHGDFLSAKSDTWSHYTWDDNREHHIGQTFWSIATKGNHDNANATGAWFGTHNGDTKGNSDLWFTMDYGDNPSFKITRMTGEATWRSGTGYFSLYGTNDISNVTGNNGSSDAGALSTTGLTEIFSVGNPGTTWDSGYQSSDYYRYYIYRITASGSPYDWGWDASKWYGDYY
jgi:hypothetical protein